MVQRGFIFLSYRSSPSLAPCGMSARSLSLCLSVSLHVGSPNLPAADPAPNLRAAFELEDVGSDSMMPRLIRCRACDVICQVLGGASLPPSHSQRVPGVRATLEARAGNY